MSEPITLTERERAVWQTMANRLHRSVFDGARDTGAEIQKVLDGSASPPRVPENGPGEPTDIDKAKRVVDRWRDARGLDAPIPWETTLARFIADALTAERRAGIEAAAKWHDDEVGRLTKDRTALIEWRGDLIRAHNLAARELRALAAAPPADPKLAGLKFVRAESYNRVFQRGWSSFYEWLDLEIAKRDIATRTGNQP